MLRCAPLRRQRRRLLPSDGRQPVGRAAAAARDRRPVRKPPSLPRSHSPLGSALRRTPNWRRNSMPCLHHLCLPAAAGASRSSDLRASLCRVCDCSLLPRDPSRAARCTLASHSKPPRSQDPASQPPTSKSSMCRPHVELLGDQVAPLDSSATSGTCVVCARFCVHSCSPSHSDPQLCRDDFLATRLAAAAGEPQACRATVLVSDLCQIVRPVRVRGGRPGRDFMSRAQQRLRGAPP